MKRVILICLPLVLAACGGPPEPPASNVVGEPLQQSLDKARSVEGLNSQRKAGMDEAVDEAN